MAEEGKIQPYFCYWGKAGGEEGQELACHLLPYHCLDVAAVGLTLLRMRPRLRANLVRTSGFDESELDRWLPFFLLLHDIGKFSTRFQDLQPDLARRLQHREAETRTSPRHDALGWLLWRDWLNEQFQLLSITPKQERRSRRRSLEQQACDVLMGVVTGHHGLPPRKPSGGLADYFSEQDQQAALDFVRDAAELLLGNNADSPTLNMDRLVMSSWWFAGFAVLSDWLGSNPKYFAYRDTPTSLECYWRNALDQAENAVTDAGLEECKTSRERDYDALFDGAIKAPTALQEQVQKLSLGSGPQLFILEDVTGAGKTEAAMMLAHRLMAHGAAGGIYFALPTMATANGMYERMQKVYRRLYADDAMPSLVLAHGARELSAQFRDSVLVATKAGTAYRDGTVSASAYCNAWIADHAKLALIADIGVGTIDQALLSILPARHQSLRMLGLMDKVLIVDEVHACDAYMHGLLQALLRAHAVAGGSAILLSATLPKAQRQSLIDAFADGARKNVTPVREDSFPLLSHWHAANENADEYPVATRKSVRRWVNVRFIHDEEAVIQRLDEAVGQGRCACWIRNTVTDACAAYALLRRHFPDWKLDLFHARYAMQDRLDIEARVVQRFGSKGGQAQRRGQVLIATQVVEQSLDLDFDLIITDLAPIDLLIQRSGRLCRHARDKDGNRIDGPDQRGEPLLCVYSPNPEANVPADWYASQFPKGQFVYPDHGKLWLTAKLLKEKGGFSMPDDARDLIEGVYGEASMWDVAVGLSEKSLNAYAESRAKAGIADLNALNLPEGYAADTANRWWDDERTPTRLGDDTIPLWLARWVDGQLKPWRQEADHSWQRSAVQVRRTLATESVIPEEIQETIVDRARKSLPAKGRWGVLLPLIETEDGWKGTVKNVRGERIDLHYDIERGLMTDEERESYESDR